MFTEDLVNNHSSQQRKMRQQKISWLTLLLAACLTACAPSVRQAKASVLECQHLGKLTDLFERAHYSSEKITPKIAERAAQNFLEMLDPSKTLLIDSEAKHIKKNLTMGFSLIEKGTCTSLNSAFDTIRNRAKSDYEYAKKVLSGKFKLDKSINLVLDADKRGYAKNHNKRKKLITKLIHFQYSNYILGGVDDEKAKTQLIHRYELNLKRLNERIADKRIPELFAMAIGNSFDPHTTYMSHDTLEDFNIQMQLSLEGIGAALRWENGFTYIDSLVPGGQAEKNGKLRPKDKVIAVAQGNDTPVSTIDMELREVVKLIRGKKGTIVTLTVLREGASTKTFKVSIVRDKIDVKQQAAKIRYVDEGDKYVTPKEKDNSKIVVPKKQPKKTRIAVLELPSFYGGDRKSGGRSSSGDVKALLAEAKKNGADAVVLDLSKNGGGYLEDAVDLSGLFIREGAIVATHQTGGNVSILHDNHDDIHWNGPLVIVLSPISASASEILAGSLQAYKRAVVVGAGKRSFGKGTVQTIQPLLPMSDRLGAIKVTIGMYFLPNGESTQQSGIEVDLVIPSLLSSISSGEKDLSYSLPPENAQPFLSKSINTKGPDRWASVTPQLIQKLREKSQVRIEKNAEFKQVKEEISKIEKQKGSISLAELMSSKEKQKEEEDDERITRLEDAFLNEAVLIALDMIKEQQ